MIFHSFDVTVDFNEGTNFNCLFGEEGRFEVEFGANVAREYHGTYEVTPTQQTQTLPTANKVLTDNVVINPIPNNYGLITYNGSTITVS